MGQCNYCSWQQMRGQSYRKATPTERKALWDKDPNEPYNSTGAVIVNREGEFACWFMELPEHCCC